MKRIVLAAATAIVAVACNTDIAGLGPPSNPATEEFAVGLGVDIAQMTRLPDGVYIKDLVVGPSTADSVSAKATSVKVTYAGFLKDGTLFDSGSNVTLDMATMIAGFRSGIARMHVGGKRKLVIPSALGYDGHAVKNTNNTIKIPRQSTLVFDVELVSVTEITDTP